MSLPAKSKKSAPSVDNSTSNDLIDVIKGRRSQELIIGLCGAIGSGVKPLKTTLKKKLEDCGYDVYHIRLSDLIIKASGNNSLQDLSGYERYLLLQDAGDSLRKNHKKTILAALAIKEIATLRKMHYGKDKELGEVIKTDKKVAYILDQLKHPDEADLLKTVYNHNFYLVGLIRTEKERRVNLEEENILPEQIDELIRRDRKDNDSFGQQVEKTLFKSDYFIRNVYNQIQLLQESVERFIKLIHGVNGITPTHDEIGMHSAYSASLRSACLSRQVGAAIMDKNGKVIATGCNDVPAAGGGLYTSSTLKDFRCVRRGQCSNDRHKQLLKEEITSVIRDFIKDPHIINDLANKITSETKIKSLIEYSRAIHAEMDAIVSLARDNSESTKEKILFATTYPCHNCARHIVAAGISRVVYIEPYEKSLALKLHDDSISDIEEIEKVIFSPFEGASPSRYEDFFKFNSERKDRNGKVIFNGVNESYHVDTQYLDDYHSYELKITTIVNDMLGSENI